jgi:hypothetical protein
MYGGIADGAEGYRAVWRDLGGAEGDALAELVAPATEYDDLGRVLEGEQRAHPLLDRADPEAAMRIPRESLGSAKTGSMGMPVTVMVSAGTPRRARWTAASSRATPHRATGRAPDPAELTEGARQTARGAARPTCAPDG